MDRKLLAAVAGALVMLGAGTVVQRATPMPSPNEPGREQRAVALLAARGLPVYCGGGRANEVALTFDDGPTGFTPRLLTALRRSSPSTSASSVPATFFLIGRNAARYPAYARAEAARGAVGIHTQAHTTLTGLPLDAARREIAAAKRTIEGVLGRRAQLFRPVGGRRNAMVDRIAAEQKLLTVMYTVDPRDWARASAESTLAAVASDPRLVPGAIILLHESRPATIEAIPGIVRILERRGLRLVSVPRLLADDPPTRAEQRQDLRAGSCVHLHANARAASSTTRGEKG